jgi:argininosuccinate lyase
MRIPEHEGATLSDRNDFRRAMWEAIAHGLAAHAIMLRDTAIVDDAISAALLTAIDGAGRGEPPECVGTLELVAAFDDRVDSLIAPAAAGAVRIGRARHDLAATAARLVLRDGQLALVDAVDASRAALIDLAESHVFTLLPVWSGASPLQPTNLAHFLSGAIAQLARAGRRLHGAYEDLDRSPMGSGAMVGSGLPVDRDELSDLLGSEGPAASTLDAVSAVDNLSAVASATAASVTPIRLLAAELLTWVRTDPQALRLSNELVARADANLPHFRPPAALERLTGEARRIENDAETVGRLVREIPYGPVGEAADDALELAVETLARATAMHEAFRSLISASLEINRAWLARNAGRSLVTAGDLADLLVAEEGLDPAPARTIAAQVATRALAEGLEASSVTPEMIDAAALLTIGRELGIEIERLGAYLAPRRFIEKRTLLGGPAPASIREHLAQERQQLADDARWLETKHRRITLAEENREIRARELFDAASAG